MGKGDVSEGPAWYVSGPWPNTWTSGSASLFLPASVAQESSGSPAVREVWCGTARQHRMASCPHLLLPSPGGCLGMLDIQSGQGMPPGEAGVNTCHPT